MSVTEIANHEEFLRIVHENKNRLIIIDYYADWCGPCKAVAPVFDQLASELPDVGFFRINVDDNDETATVVGVTSLPTFHAYFGTEKLEELIGADPQALRDLVASNLRT